MTAFRLGLMRGFVLGNILAWTGVTVWALVTGRGLLAPLGVLVLIGAYITWSVLEGVRPRSSSSGEGEK